MVLGFLPGTGYTTIVGTITGTKTVDRFAFSVSGSESAIASYTTAASAPGHPGGVVTASPTIVKPGEAAVEATDPYLIPEGTFLYNAIVDGFSLATNPGEVGGAR